VEELEKDFAGPRPAARRERIVEIFLDEGTRNLSTILPQFFTADLVGKQRFHSNFGEEL
jgi:hypothetical protein